MTAGSCYACLGSLSQFETMKLELLAQIALAASPSADVTPQGLLDAAKCYECATNASMAQLMELALLAIIAGP